MKNSNPVIAFDVDGVLLDIHTPWIAWYNQEYGDSLTVDDVTDYYVPAFMPKANLADVMAFIQDPILYDELAQPIPGALDVVTDLQRRGAEIVFVSHTYPSVYDAKIRALMRYGFLANPAQYIACHSKYKYLVAADALIEDCEQTAIQHPGGMVFSRPWNQEAQAYIPFISSYRPLDYVANLIYTFTMLQDVWGF